MLMHIEKFLHTNHTSFGGKSSLGRLRAGSRELGHAAVAQSNAAATDKGFNSSAIVQEVQLV